MPQVPLPAPEGHVPIAPPAPGAQVQEPPKPSRWARFKWRVSEASWWHWTYALDYLLILLLFALGQFVARYAIEPFHRFLPAGSTDVAYPLKSSIIPVWLLMVLSVAVPVAAFALYQIWGRSAHDFHHATLGVLEGFGFAVFFTQYLKLYVGKYRPNWLASQTSDGRSGHSAVAMQSAIFLSLWLAGKLGIMKKTGGHVWQQFIVFLPIIGAALIAFSRTRDYHHDFVDTLGGVVLGGSLAVFNYFLKYPPLWKKDCEIPKRRWYQPHRNAAQWSERYAQADANVPPGQRL